MIRNYLKIALRNLKREKVSTVINVIGLAIGLATCLLIMAYVQQEFSYDRCHEYAERIFRVGVNLRLNGKDVNGPTLGPTAARDLQQEFPEVLQTTRVRNQGGKFVSNGTTAFKEERLLYADSTFFDVFTLHFIKGNPKKALTEPNTVIITAEIARKYFGDQEPIGKVLLFGSEKAPYRVTAVVGSVPTNSHFEFDMLASLAGFKEAQTVGWLDNMNFYTYVLLPEKYDYKKLIVKSPQLAEKQIEGELRKFLSVSLEQFCARGDKFEIFLQPITDIHLRSPFAGAELKPGGDIQNVYVLIAIAIFMLMIACVNFMNLSTARAVRRSREIGVRKVLGSQKTQLRQQFLTESVLLALMALFIGMLIAIAAQPYFSQLTGSAFALRDSASPLLMAASLVVALMVGLLAGSYPAFYLSSFKPVSALKGRVDSGGGGGLNFRSVLVIFQFFITITLIIATLTADEQLRFMQSKKVGFDRERVLVIHETYMLRKNEAIFRDQIAQIPQVVATTLSGDVPVGSVSSDNAAVMPKENPEIGVASRLYHIDYEYIPTLGMHIVQGRNFSKELASDSSAVLLNETAVRALGWTQGPIGKELIGHTDDDGTKRIYRVIGVVSDFHFESLRHKIGPLVLFLGNNSGNILLKTRTDHLPQLLASLKQQWESFSLAAPFSYSFLDDRFEQVYAADQKMRQVLTLFSSLTIFVACLGLFGLATYTAAQRTKEIGVRKVLGASTGSVVALLSKDFVKLVLIGFVLASPVAWWGMNQWLNDFAYRVTIGWWVYALAGLLAIGIALLTVSFQSLKAALTNPVKSLRSE
ncbi:MAG: ABC transporter permease [Dyadobacter sp.]|uniref:ABC transporter permease n=1 Tax=Dyadobacter sp. TaxID=1914288 RepID=UPI001B231CAB|nr:ABC transporter permease [Dyadobacter sp.]MBO9616315.1 ABC transporter permease [Dyadobacter sp.]